jgi:hypothetical protein
MQLIKIKNKAEGQAGVFQGARFITNRKWA